MSVSHQLVQPWSTFFCAAYSHVDIFRANFPPSPLAVFAQFAQLHGNILAVICRADSRVDCHAVYSVGSHVAPPVCNWVRACRLLQQAAGPLFTTASVSPCGLGPCGSFLA